MGKAAWTASGKGADSGTPRPPVHGEQDRAVPCPQHPNLILGGNPRLKSKDTQVFPGQDLSYPGPLDTLAHRPDFQPGRRVMHLDPVTFPRHQPNPYELPARVGKGVAEDAGRPWSAVGLGHDRTRHDPERKSDKPSQAHGDHTN